MSLIKQIIRAVGTQATKTRQLGNPVPSVFSGLRSGIGYRSDLKSFGLGGSSDELSNIQRKKGKAKSQIGGDDKDITKGVASAIANGDIILSDARKFDINKPVNRSVINIYNPRRVEISKFNQSGDDTASERREKELEASRRMNERRRGEAAAARASLLGLGASSALGDADAEGGEGGGDSLLEDATDVAAGAAGLSVLSKVKKWGKSLFGMGKKAIVGGTKFIYNKTRSLASGTMNVLRTARATTGSAVQKAVSVGGRTVESARALTRSNKVRGALKSVAGLSRGAGLAVRALATDPLLLPLWLASYGIEEGLDMAEETQNIYGDVQSALGAGVNEKFKDRLDMLDEFGGSPPADYHSSMAEQIGQIQQGIYARISVISEKMRETTDPKLMGTLREEKSQLMRIIREGEGIPASMRYAYPEDGGNRKTLSGSFDQIIQEHEKLAEEKVGLEPLESSEGLRERIRKNASGLVGSASFGNDSGMSSLFDITGGLKYVGGQLGFGGSRPSMSPPQERTQTAAPQVITVPVPAGGGQPQILSDNPASTRTEESKALRDNTIGSGATRGTPGLD